MKEFLDPALLFFVFGIAAGAMRSNLEIPPPIARFLSLYLLMALGLKGGFALAKSGLTAEVAVTLGSAVALAIIVPALILVPGTGPGHGLDGASRSWLVGNVIAAVVAIVVTWIGRRSRGIEPLAQAQSPTAR